MSKVRVSALAKELGVTSKVLLERLNGMGEYVKSASSTIEPPVVRRYREKFPEEAPQAAAAHPFRLIFGPGAGAPCRKSRSWIGSTSRDRPRMAACGLGAG